MSLQPLSQAEEQAFLSSHPEWRVVADNTGKQLYRCYVFSDFNTAFAFMVEASNTLIIPQNHHPCWQNSFNRLEIWLSTSELNGQLSVRDTDLAADFESLWQRRESHKQTV